MLLPLFRISVFTFVIFWGFRQVLCKSTTNDNILLQQTFPVPHWVKSNTDKFHKVLNLTQAFFFFLEVVILLSLLCQSNIIPNAIFKINVLLYELINLFIRKKKIHKGPNNKSNNDYLKKVLNNIRIIATEPIVVQLQNPLTQMIVLFNVITCDTPKSVKANVCYLKPWPKLKLSVAELIFDNAQAGGCR